MIMPQISGYSGSATRNNEVTCLLWPIVVSTLCQSAVAVQAPTHSVPHSGTQTESSSYQWKCVCTTGAISDEFHQWDGEVDCRTESDMLWPQLRLRLWPTAAYTTLQHTTLPSRSHNGNAKKSMVYGKLITPQRKLAQLTCLRWIYLGSNEAKCGQVTNASEASRNHFISAGSGEWGGKK